MLGSARVAYRKDLEEAKHPRTRHLVIPKCIGKDIDISDQIEMYAAHVIGVLREYYELRCPGEIPVTTTHALWADAPGTVITSSKETI